MNDKWQHCKLKTAELSLLKVNTVTKSNLQYVFIQNFAGTTANVGCRIIGEYGKSASQHLNKKGAFQRNCSDSFIMAFDVNLGELKKVLVWHDNRGSSPSWYLNHVIVKDLQTDKKYYFFSNSWLTLEEDNGAIQKELKAAGKAVIKK